MCGQNVWVAQMFVVTLGFTILFNVSLCKCNTVPIHEHTVPRYPNWHIIKLIPVSRTIACITHGQTKFSVIKSCTFHFHIEYGRGFEIMNQYIYMKLDSKTHHNFDYFYYQYPNLFTTLLSDVSLLGT